MTTEVVADPFAGIEDDVPMRPAERREALLRAAKRGYVPLRKVLVQQTKGARSRAAVLADLVHDRQERALDALLLVHALQPILPGSPLPLGTWAALLSLKAPCTSNAASKTFGELVERRLVTRHYDGRRPIIEPLHEDGTGAAWTRPGQVEEEGPGYFVLPHAYWTQGLAEHLALPGKAMLLIILAETQDPRKQTFSMPVERAQEWYGISERTAERGYLQLAQAGLLQVRVQKVADARHPAGRREVYHRALGRPFGTIDRMRLQKRTVKAVQKRLNAAEAERG